MKLVEIRTLYEKDEERYHKKWSDEELEVIHKEVKKTSLSKEEMAALAKEIETSEKLERTYTGIYQMIMQMHMIVHGEYPQGVVVYEGNWQKVAGNAIRFGKEKGYDVEPNIKKAKADMKERVAKKKSQVKEPEARQMMADYYKEHKEQLPKNISSHREEIIQDIMKGTSPEEAFKKFTSDEDK